MNLEDVFCMNRACPDKYKRGAGNIVSHGRKRPRCKCSSCGRTFSYRQGTMFYGLRYPMETIILVVALVGHGCPEAAIVAPRTADQLSSFVMARLMDLPLYRTDQYGTVEVISNGIQMHIRTRTP